MRIRERMADPQLPAIAQPGTTDGSAGLVHHPNVMVSSGIHRGRFPVAGLTVREARQSLESMMSISSDAIAVIGGQPVDENQRIDESVTLLSFVKPSSLRGSGDVITIEGNLARLSTGHGEPHCVSIDDFARRITGATVHGLDDPPFPDHVRWVVECGHLKVCIIELPPELRCIHWIAQDSPAPYGPEATTSLRCLATPYVVVKVPFRRERLIGRIEVFYRNEPLRSLDGDGGALLFPNLLNLSPWAHNCVCWCCTQFVDFTTIPPGIAEGLHFVANFLFSGKLNLSSEAHEGLSSFGLTCREVADRRVADVDGWEAASRENPRFATTVPWKPTGVTVRALILRELAHFKVKPAPGTVAELGNLMLRRTKPK